MIDDNILYWLFTTAPQAIAALVGITFTGMIFMVGNIDNKVKIDSTLYDIAEAAKVAMYKNLRIVAGLSLFVIVYDLFMVRGVKCISIGNGVSELLYWGFWILNISSFIVVSRYVFQVVHPNYFDKIVTNMSKGYKEGTVDSETFLRHFIDFERVVRTTGESNKRNEFISLPEINNMLVSDGIITKEESWQLSEARKIRNLIVHGHDIKMVETKIDDALVQITEKIRKFLSR